MNHLAFYFKDRLILQLCSVIHDILFPLFLILDVYENYESLLLKECIIFFSFEFIITTFFINFYYIILKMEIFIMEIKKIKKKMLKYL